MPTLQEYIKKLPPDLEKEVKDFVEFLLKKRGRRPHNKLSQTWAGALKKHKSEYTSIELQKKSLQWRDE